jgi:hypothetical protein
LAVSSKIPAEFARLTDEQRTKFAEATLEALIKIARNPKARQKVFKRYFTPKKKGRPKALTQSEIDTIQQIITVFLYSLKEEFRYHWAKIVCLFLPPQMLPEGLFERIEKRMKEVKHRRFIHLSFEPEPYKQLMKTVDALGGWDAFMNHAVEALNEKMGE